MHMAKTSATIQPSDLRSCSPQKYRTIGGTTPKLTKSASESSSAPKRVVPSR